MTGRWSRLWRGAGAVALALTAGVLAGNSAVSGMIGFDSSYAPPAAGTDAIASAEAAEERAAADAAPPPSATPVGYRPDIDCPDCGDYAAGWRWAEQRDLRDDSACNNESWSFSRGCIAYVTGGTLPNS